MAKVIAQIIITGAQVFGRAFARAIRQEIQASEQSARKLEDKNKARHLATNAQMGMTVDEAKLILDVNDLDPEKIEKRYNYLRSINDRSKGGSIYILSKIVRAKERLDYEIKKAGS